MSFELTCPNAAEIPAKEPRLALSAILASLHKGEVLMPYASPWKKWGLKTQQRRDKKAQKPKPVKK